MELQDNMKPNALPRRGRHAKPVEDPAEKKIKPLKDVEKPAKHLKESAAVEKPMKQKDHKESRKSFLPDTEDWEFSSLSLGISSLAVITGMAYAAFSVFNELCPVGSSGSCSKIPVGSLGSFFEISLLVIFIAFTAVSALCAVESIARMVKMTKAYISLGILLVTVSLISAAIPQDIIRDIAFRLLG